MKASVIVQRYGSSLRVALAAVESRSIEAESKSNGCSISPRTAWELEEFANQVYPAGRRQAALDIGLKRSEWKVIPTISQWSLEQIMDPDFFPLSDTE